MVGVGYRWQHSQEVRWQMYPDSGCHSVVIVHIRHTVLCLVTLRAHWPARFARNWRGLR